MTATFSIQRRTDIGVPKPHEPRYEYLDRSARTEAIAIRRLVRHWLGFYPREHRNAWRSRFASGDDGQYYSASWELYLFTYFRRLGFSIEVEPNSQGGKVKAPDFRMRRGDLAFYLEATTAHDLAPGEHRVRRWKADVRGAIDAIKSNDFFVSLDWLRDPTAQTTSAAQAKAVANWLAGLQYTSVYAAFHEQIGELPTLRLETGGGRLRVSPIPKAHRRATPGLIGAEGFGLRQVNVLQALQRAVREKSSRYGELYLPYIVAVNVLADFGGEDEYVDALFGTPQIAVMADGRQVFGHDKDGSFGTPRHPRAQRVSAILCVCAIYPRGP